MKRTWTYVLIGLYLVFTALPVTLRPAYADCSPDPAPDGSTVVCDGLDLDGTTAGDMVTIQVTEDAAVYDTATPTEHVITTENDATIVVDGTVTAAGSGDAIHTGDDAAITVGEEGTVVSENADAIDVKDNASITNDGIIDSNGDHAIEAGNNLEVVNNGILEATGDVIAAGDSAYIVNNDEINSTYADGIDVGHSAYIENNGTISTALGGNAIEVDSAHIVNNSTIQGHCNGIEAEGSTLIDNHGNISGYECAAIEGGDSVVVNNSGDIHTRPDNYNAAVDLDHYAVVDNSGQIRANCKGVRGGEWLNVSNSGMITSEHCDTIAGTFGYVNNTGTITASDDGIDLDEGGVFNYNGGVISGDDVGVDFNGSQNTDTDFDFEGETFVSNRVDSLITGGIGISANHAGNVDSQNVYNQGTIEGTMGTAVALGAGNDRFSGAIGTYGREGQTHTFESQAIGIVDGGADDDVFEIDYHYNGDDAEAVNESSRIEEIANNAATQNCPCVVSFTLFGMSFNYTYTNFEKVVFKKSCWDFGTGSCGGSDYLAATAAPVADKPEETAPALEVAAVIQVDTAPVEETPTTSAAEVMAVAEIESMIVETTPVAEVTLSPDVSTQVSTVAPVMSVNMSERLQAVSSVIFIVPLTIHL